MVDKSVDAILLKLRGLYTRAKELSESEISASTALIGLLDGLLQSGASTAQRKKIEIGEQKKKRIKSDTDTARFSAASMRNQLDQAANLKGEQVAARVKSDDEKDEWFVVKVIHFDKETKEYEVLDEEPGDDEESTQKFDALRERDVGPRRRLPAHAAAAGQPDGHGGPGPALLHRADGGVPGGGEGRARQGAPPHAHGRHGGHADAPRRPPQPLRPLAQREGAALQRLHPLVPPGAHRHLERHALPDAPRLA